MNKLAEGEYLNLIQNELKGEIFQEIQKEAEQLLFITPEHKLHLKEKLQLKLKKLESIMAPLYKNIDKLSSPKVSCANSITRYSVPHDRITILNSRKEICERSKELYIKGYSLRAIALELKLSKSTTRNYLLQNEVMLRSHSKKNRLHSNIKIKIAPRNAPYGYFLFRGILQENSKEQAVIQLITKLNRKSLSQGAIARQLNELKIKPRRAAQWKQVTIGKILRRIALKGGTAF